MKAVVFLACIAIAAAHFGRGGGGGVIILGGGGGGGGGGFGGYFGGRTWCTCRPACFTGEQKLDRTCRLGPLFPLAWDTCCRQFPWWVTNNYAGYGGAGYELGYGGLGGFAGGAFYGGGGYGGGYGGAGYGGGYGGGYGYGRGGGGYGKY